MKILNLVFNKDLKATIAAVTAILPVLILAVVYTSIPITDTSHWIYEIPFISSLFWVPVGVGVSCLSDTGKKTKALFLTFVVMHVIGMLFSIYLSLGFSTDKGIFALNLFGALIIAGIWMLLCYPFGIWRNVYGTPQQQ